jgi:raffinose/stachyose/melibiose transport system substrate-binding protein
MRGGKEESEVVRKALFHSKGHRWWKVLVGAVCVSGLLVTGACGSDDSGGGGDGGPVTLRFIAGQSLKIGWDPMVQGFNTSHPDIKVDVQYLESAKLGQIVSTQIQAGNAPDIVYANPGSGGGATGLDLYKLAKAGQLEPLPDEPWATDIPEVTKPAVTVDGKVYGVLAGMSSYGVLYETDALKELGKDLPESWDELIGLCAAAKKHGRHFTGTSGMAADNRVVLQSLSAAYVYGADPDWDQKRADGKVTFAGTPGWKKVMDHLKQLIDADCYAPGAAGRTRDESLKLTDEGKTVGSVTTSAAYEYRKAQNKDASPAVFGLVPEPEGTMPLGLTGMSVSSKSKHKDAALQFVKFVGENRELFAKPMGYVTPEQLEQGTLPDFMSTLDATAKAGKYSLAAGTMWANSSVLRAAMEQMTGLFTGQTTAEQVLKAMDEAWDS